MNATPAIHKFLFFLLFRRFLPPNQDQAVYSKVLVSVCETRFPLLLAGLFTDSTALHIEPDGSEI